MKGRKDLAKLTKKTITDKNGNTRTVWVKMDKKTKVEKPKKKVEKEETKVASHNFKRMEDLISFMSKKRFTGTAWGDPSLPENRDIMLDAMAYAMKSEGKTVSKDPSDLYLDDEDAGEEFETYMSDGILGVIRENLDDNETMDSESFDEKYGEGMYDKILSDNPNDVMSALQAIKKVTETDKKFTLGTKFLEGLIKIVDI